MAYKSETLESVPLPVTALDYVLYLRRRWAFIAVACITAGVLALLATLLMQTRYTSSATILIEPAAGADPRASTAISPIYLESLKTFETVATSGNLFEKAVEKFQLRSGSNSGQSIEGIKARILKVTKLRDTKILEIEVTLPDPKQAQAMAQFVAEETVKMTASVSRDAGRDLVEDLDHQADDARKQLSAAQTEWAKTKAAVPVESARMELDSTIENLARLRADLYDAEASNAEYASANTKAKIDSLTARVHELDQTVTTKSKLLAEASTRIEVLEADRQTKQTAYDLALRRAQELRASLLYGTERLKVIDPGTVPEKPSEPRRMLYAVIAFGLALVGSIVYLSASYGLRA
ncbi:MAG TPA: hypothetical protein VGL53_08860 [Bryobacteraceae bacterium]